MAPVNVFLAWIWTQKKQGTQNVKPMRSKVLFLDSFSQGLEQLSEMQFLPKGSGASPRHPYERNQSRKKGVTLVTIKLISLSSLCSSPMFLLQVLKRGSGRQMKFVSHFEVMVSGWGGGRKTQFHTVMVIIPISHQEAACPAQLGGKEKWILTFPEGLPLITPPSSSKVWPQDWKEDSIDLTMQKYAKG